MVKEQTKDSSNERTSYLPFEQISVSEDENSHARKEEYQTPQHIYIFLIDIKSKRSPLLVVAHHNNGTYIKKILF
ncbi:hypothetical protein AYI69_g8649 [Smittium culicis]|uniref:Uncharacterized protein n=1 Tax=Smittium culicis TaxID=133412 RepID=A0A1R1XI44_9FUNG|nr:hypothetical protein AYI69_g8649 [Smittium culicis]